MALMPYSFLLFNFPTTALLVAVYMDGAVLSPSPRFALDHGASDDMGHT
jgi:hypothetical protein